jgi:glucokinase
MVADVGGTNTRVALAEGRLVDATSVRRYRNAEHPGLDSVLRTYAAEAGGAACDGAAVAVAGPVREGVGVLTNLDWRIDGPTLSRATGAGRTAILNDMQAQGHALGALAPGAVTEVVAGPDAGPDAAKLVVNVGTGFNASPVVQGPVGRVVPASECGHANLPIRNEAELRLCRFVETAHGFPAIEDVLSGRGLERVYAWLGHEAGDPREARAAEIMALLNRGDERARETARVFVKILGTVCGNLSLVHLPFGGVFLVGGVARAFRDHLAAFGFEEAFRDKGRFAGFMRNFRISMVEDDNAALTGLASHLTLHEGLA